MMLDDVVDLEGYRISVITYLYLMKVLCSTGKVPKFDYKHMLISPT